MKKLGCVYFLRQQSVDGYIKIGFSTEINKRQADLQVSSPYELRCVAILFDETRTTEKFIHMMLRESNIRGEWFYPSEEVLECVEYINNFKFNELMERYINIIKGNIS